MKSLFVRGSAALLIAATALTAACSNNDPMAPSATAGANAARSTTAIGGPVHASGYIVAWGRDSSSSASSAGHVPTAPTAGPTTGGAAPTSGYIVAWGRGDGSAPQP